MGLVFLLFTRHAEQAIAELEHALALDPNLAFAHAQIGFAKAVLGHAEDTEAHVTGGAAAQSAGLGVYVWCDFLGVAKLMLGRRTQRLFPGSGERSRRIALIRSRIFTTQRR